jgi:hypothetical protein
VNFARVRFRFRKNHLLCYPARAEEAVEGHTVGRKTDGGFDPAIDAELAILTSIETRYSEELAKLERSPKPPDVRERLREQLEAQRKMAREPHVLRLTELHRQAQTKMVFSRMTKH